MTKPISTATFRRDELFCAWLEETLIPDLKESGSLCTAEDFERCVRIIRKYATALKASQEVR